MHALMNVYATPPAGPCSWQVRLLTATSSQSAGAGREWVLAVETSVEQFWLRV